MTLSPCIKISKINIYLLKRWLNFIEYFVTNEMRVLNLNLSELKIICKELKNIARILRPFGRKHNHSHGIVLLERRIHCTIKISAWEKVSVYYSFGMYYNN